MHAFISLYPLNPSPPSQPSALPALPTLLTPSTRAIRKPRLITLYPATSTLTIPDNFASQVLTSTHQLLQTNLAASTSAKIISVFVGNVDLPTLPAMISRSTKTRREAAKQQINAFRAASTASKLSIVRDWLVSGLNLVYWNITGRLGLGQAARDYAFFERQILGAVKSTRRQHFVGQYSLVSVGLTRIHPLALPYVMAVLPALPSVTGPAAPRPLYAAPRSRDGKDTPVSRTSRSVEGSDHESIGSGSAEDLAASFHGVTSTSGESLPGSGSDSGLSESWVGLESGSGN